LGDKKLRSFTGPYKTGGRRFEGPAKLQECFRNTKQVLGSFATC
jgi:hypothetical protein